MNKIALLLFSLVISFASGFSQVPVNGLVAYFPFSGDANNSGSLSTSSYINSATLTSDRFNHPNSAYEFNGVNSYISISNEFDLPQRTISFWFNADTIDGTPRMIFSSDNPSLNNGLAVALVMKINGTNYASLALGYERANVQIAPKEWHNVVFVNTNSISTIYFDCKPVLQTTDVANTSVNGLTKTIIGASRNSNNYYFDGKIDDIRIYDWTFNSQDVQAMCSEMDPCTDFAKYAPLNDVNARGGSAASFEVFSNANNINFSWQMNTGNGFVDVPNNCFYDGIQTSKLNLNVVANSLNNSKFRCIVNNAQCTDTTNEATLSVDSVSKVQINDTIHFEKYDTTHIAVYDTTHLNTYDTLVIKFKTDVNLLNYITLKVYPNPTDAAVTVDFGEFQLLNNYTLTLQNSLAQMVYTAKITQQKVNLDLSSWTGAGVYILSVVDGDGNIVQSRKIVVK